MGPSGRQLSRRELLQWGVVLGGGAIGAGLVGCGASSPSSSPGASASGSAKPSAMKFPATEAAGSHVHDAAAMAPALVADALGYFKDAGLDQKITDFTGGGSDPIRAILTGGNMGYGFGLSTASALTAFTQGQPVRIIAGNMNDPANQWLVKPDSPLKSIHDLKGKKAGFSSPGSVSHFALTASLRKAGILDQVTLVPVGGSPDSWTAVKTGVVDASWNGDPLTSQLVKNGEARVLFAASDFLTAYISTCTVSTESYIKQNLPVLQAVTTALNRAMQSILKEPDRAAKGYAQVAGIDEGVALASLKALTDKGWTITLPPDGLKAVETGLLEMKLIKDKIDWSKVIDQSALPKELQMALPS